MGYQKYEEKSCQKSSSFFITVQWNAIGILMFENLKAIYAIVRAIFCVILTFIYVPVRGNGVTSVNEGAPVRTVCTHINTRAHIRI